MNIIKGNNTVDINDIIAMETKVVSLPVTQDIIYDRVAAQYYFRLLGLLMFLNTLEKQLNCIKILY